MMGNDVEKKPIIVQMLFFKQKKVSMRKTPPKSIHISEVKNLAIWHHKKLLYYFTYTHAAAVDLF